MSKPCSTCNRTDAALIDAQIAAGRSLSSIAAELEIPRTSLRRHAENHVGRSQAPTSDAPGAYELAAVKVIAATRTKRGAAYGPQDELEAEHLLGTARMVDQKPDNASALRELRITLAEMRRDAASTPETAQNVADFFQQAILAATAARKERK